MPTHRPIVPQKLLRLSSKPAKSTSSGFCRLRVAPIMTRCSCHGSRRSACYLFRAATATVIGPTNTPRPKISHAEPLCLRKRWRPWRRKRINPTNSRLLSSHTITHTLADCCISGLQGLVDEIAALAVREERALHRVDGDFFEIIHREA